MSHLNIPRNVLGRDFVVGDLHGCFEQLEHRLDEYGFDEHHDRLFSVGDLVDRGPHSERALDWLRKPWFYACLGNHEEMLLDATGDADERHWWADANGSAWWSRAGSELRDALVGEWRQLPLSMEVETEWGRVGIVHADCPRGQSWPQFTEQLAAGSERARQVALWSRSRFDRGRREGVDGIERVVVGHTITDNWQVRVLGNVWCIDTGAFLAGREPGAHLTVLELGELFVP